MGVSGQLARIDRAELEWLRAADADTEQERQVAQKMTEWFALESSRTFWLGKDFAGIHFLLTGRNHEDEEMDMDWDAIDTQLEAQLGDGFAPDQHDEDESEAAEEVAPDPLSFIGAQTFYGEKLQYRFAYGPGRVFPPAMVKAIDQALRELPAGVVKERLSQVNDEDIYPYNGSADQSELRGLADLVEELRRYLASAAEAGDAIIVAIR
jgi:hypothetical protein